MKIDILKHHYVPQHEILSSEEVEELSQYLDYDIKFLPKIKLEDPVVKQIGAEEGNVLKITRESRTAGTFVTYRLVEE